MVIYEPTLASSPDCPQTDPNPYRKDLAHWKFLSLGTTDPNPTEVSRALDIGTLEVFLSRGSGQFLDSDHRDASVAGFRSGSGRMGFSRKGRETPTFSRTHMLRHILI